MIFVFSSRENLSVFAVPLVCCTSYDLSSNNSYLNDYWHVDFYQETYWRTSQYGLARRCIPLTVSFSLSPPLTSGFRFCSFFRSHHIVSKTWELSWWFRQKLWQRKPAQMMCCWGGRRLPKQPKNFGSDPNVSSPKFGCWIMTLFTAIDSWIYPVFEFWSHHNSFHSLSLDS